MTEASSSNLLRKIIVGIGIFIGILGVLISVLLKLIGLVPAFIALIFGLGAFFLAKKENQRKTGSYVIFALVIISALISSISEFAFENKVEQDIEMQTTIEGSVDSVDAELLEALEDLDMEVDESEELIKE